jgi:hypothetical protein
MHLPTAVRKLVPHHLTDQLYTDIGVTAISDILKNTFADPISSDLSLSATYTINNCIYHGQWYGSVDSVFGAYKKTHPYTYVTRHKYPQTGTVLVHSANHRTLKNTNIYGNRQMLVYISLQSTEWNLPLTEFQGTEFFVSVVDRVALTQIHKFGSAGR